MPGELGGTWMSVLEHAKARALLAETELTGDSVRGCQERLTRYLQRYLPVFYRKEQHQHVLVVVQGRLGKLDNCQVGVFWGYASSKGRALVDRRLYLSKDWAADRQRRKKCHVPQ